MKRENTQLRQQLALSTQLLTALASGHEVSSILRGLRDQEDPATIAQRITSSSPLPSVKRNSSPDSGGNTLSLVPLHGKHESDLSNFDPVYKSPFEKTSSTMHESDLSSLDSPYASPLKKPSTSTTLDASSQTAQINGRLSSSRSIRGLRSQACCGPTDLSDHRLIKHLFSIYWIWVHPTHTILNME